MGVRQVFLFSLSMALVAIVFGYAVGSLMVCTPGDPVATGNVRMEYVDGNLVTKERYHSVNVQCPTGNNFTRGLWLEEK